MDRSHHSPCVHFMCFLKIIHNRNTIHNDFLGQVSYFNHERYDVMCITPRHKEETQWGVGYVCSVFHKSVFAFWPSANMSVCGKLIRQNVVNKKKIILMPVYFV
jgi:hypothetical protein